MADPLKMGSMVKSGRKMGRLVKIETEMGKMLESGRKMRKMVKKRRKIGRMMKSARKMGGMVKRRRKMSIGPEGRCFENGQYGEEW